ncbi:hypothetical protein Hdeb2414_s0018g00526701 [Helianthus debilis subsp. tardiflorus]
MFGITSVMNMDFNQYGCKIFISARPREILYYLPCLYILCVCMFESRLILYKFSFQWDTIIREGEMIFHMLLEHNWFFCF